MNFIPVRSAFQTSVGDPVGPDSYLSSNVRGPLGTLQAAFGWQMTYLCRFHQIMYADLQRRDGLIAQKNERREKIAADATKSDEDEVFILMNSRALTAILNMDDDVARTKHLADEYTVIGLWATAEQYLGKAFRPLVTHVDRVPETTAKPPSKWDPLVARYATLGIDLTTLDLFTDADECRVLNNKIKHAGYVDARLAQYTFFASHLNAKLLGIELPMQRYVNGVTHFVGSLIGRVNQIIDPSFKP